ncbi:phage tail protein [Desulfosporosinus sp. BG]|uniref:phage tail protein n=1 Tax=Desulfosporosinus sp. BG TaxID=1633135 RepID=UPI000839FEFD|nr:phage tail protein [Desulfosporosinus sp. BG]ODA40663.1 hypothetical protein DSBG_2560 [Desulfosporosinus sp. BG]
MATGKRKNPYTNFKFLVEINGMVVAGFSEVYGLQAETETEEYREGGVNHFVLKLPKVTSYPNLTLKRGLTDSDALYKWYRDVAVGSIVRKQVSVVVLDHSGNEVRRWNFSQAYPVKWTGPELSADSSAIAVEVVELVHKGLI